METNTNYENYVVVMLSNGMHLTGEISDPNAITFGRLELRDMMILNFSPKGEMGLSMHPLGDIRFILYPVMILKFRDMPTAQREGITNAYRQKHSRIQLVRQ